MNNCNWTAGPWILDLEYLDVWSDQKPICDIHTEDMQDLACNTVKTSEEKANAHLIAAAPELYDLMQQCKAMGLLTIGYDSGADHKRLCADADRIMTKARGETE